MFIGELVEGSLPCLASWQYMGRYFSTGVHRIFWQIISFPFAATGSHTSGSVGCLRHMPAI